MNTTIKPDPTPQPETQATPRVDANERCLGIVAEKLDCRPLEGFCEASFARRLERDLDTARAELATVKDHNDRLVVKHDEWCRERDERQRYITSLEAQLSASTQKVEEMRRALEKVKRIATDDYTQIRSGKKTLVAIEEALASTPAQAVSPADFPSEEEQTEHWKKVLSALGYISPEDEQKLREENERLQREGEAAWINRNRFCEHIYIIGLEVLGFTGPNCAPDAVSRETKKLVAALRARCDRLEGALRAGMRLKEGRYVSWFENGGPNPCKHGCAEGISCPKCDEEAIESAEQALSEPAKAEGMWRLPDPPTGREWSHAELWTQDMLSPGERPLLVDELLKAGDLFRHKDTKKHGDVWAQETADCDHNYGGPIFMRKTSRPLPATTTEPKEKAK